MLFKRSITLFFLFCISTSFAQHIDVQHYRFELELTDHSDSIRGKATVTIKFLEEADNLQLNLQSVARGRGMNSNTVTENGSVLPSVHQKDILTVSLPVSAKKNETRTIEILYSGIPADGLIISKNKWGDRTFFGDNWPNRARHWLPCNDRPDDKSSVEFLVTAPAHYQVVSNGIKIEETALDNNRKYTHWREEVPLPTKVMVIGAARFVISYIDSTAPTPITAWVYPQDSQRGFYDYALTGSILNFFSNYIAPYPYRKLANVQSKTIFGGMENASAIFYAEETVTGDRKSEDLMAHEIVHQWFGNMATEKNFAHFWLSEGFATYLTNVYIESKYGQESARKRLIRERELIIRFVRTNNKPVVDSASALMDLLNANSYQKGGWVLHMLRNEVGDTVFKSIVSSYYNQYKGSNADTRNFQQVAEKVSSKEFEAFFHQWLYQPGIPKINVQWEYADGKVLLTIQQTTKHHFQFPLEVALIDAAGNQTMQKFSITKQTENFAFSSNKPVQVILDPNINLLFEGKVNEVK